MFDLLGLLSLTGAQNPDLFAKVMASQGVSPTQASGVPGTSLGTMPDVGGLGGLLAGQPAIMPSAAATGASLENSTPAAAALSGRNILQALQAVKAPQAPAPIMNAGVSGSQKAPDLTAVKSTGSANATIMNLLANLGAAGSAVPSLGTLLKGV